VRGDLSRAVNNLIESGRTIDRIVIETTGLAERSFDWEDFRLKLIAAIGEWEDPHRSMTRHGATTSAGLARLNACLSNKG
jgi:G3E family GTPase